MNLAKHMEAIVLAAAILLCALSVVGAADRPALLRPVAMQVAHADTPVTVVTVTARRLSAAEKAALPI